MTGSKTVDRLSEFASLVCASDSGRIRVVRSNKTYTLLGHDFDWKIAVYDLTVANVMDFLLKIATISPLSEDETLSILPENFLTACPSEDGPTPTWVYHHKVGDQYLADFAFKQLQGTWWSLDIPSFAPDVVDRFQRTCNDVTAAVAQLILYRVQLDCPKARPGSAHAELSARRVRNGLHALPNIKNVSISAVEAAYQAATGLSASAGKD